MSLGGNPWLHPFSRGEERKTDEKNITRRLNYSRSTAFDEAVFVKGTQDWIDLLCLLYAVQSRRCRRRRKGSSEKRGGGSGGEGLSWGADTTIGDSGSGTHGLTNGLQQPSACTNQMLWGVGGGGQKGGGGVGENVGPRGRRCPHFLHRHVSREHKASFVVRFQYHNPVMGRVNGHSRHLRGCPSETTKRKLGRWRWRWKDGGEGGVPPARGRNESRGQREGEASEGMKRNFEPFFSNGFIDSFNGTRCCFEILF